MRECKVIGAILLALAALSLIWGCANIPIKDGELALSANTTASVDGIGVARIKKQF